MQKPHRIKSLISRRKIRVLPTRERERERSHVLAALAYCLGVAVIIAQNVLIINCDKNFRNYKRGGYSSPSRKTHILGEYERTRSFFS